MGMQRKPDLKTDGLTRVGVGERAAQVEDRAAQDVEAERDDEWQGRGLGGAAAGMGGFFGRGVGKKKGSEGAWILEDEGDLVVVGCEGGEDRAGGGLEIRQFPERFGEVPDESRIGVEGKVGEGFRTGGRGARIAEHVAGQGFGLGRFAGVFDFEEPGEEGED